MKDNPAQRIRVLLRKKLL